MSDDAAPVTYDDWCDALQDGTVLGVACDECGWTSATPKRVCTECGGRSLSGTTLPGEGVVHSETTIAVGPAGVESPYRVGVVDLCEARLLARLEGEVEIGSSVTFAGTVVQDGSPAPVFEPTS